MIWRYHTRYMTTKRALVCFVIALAAAGAAPSAHHSSAVYTDDVVVFKNATMRSFVWANPHCFLIFDVKDASGSVTSWTVESGTPTSLTRVGWTRNSLQPGDTFAIEFNPARNDAKVGRLVKVILADGKELLDTQVRSATAGFAK